MTNARMLPAGFEALEEYVSVWAKPTVDARLAARGKTSMPEIRSFYDAAIERAAEMLAYLEQFDLYEMPEDAGRLMQLLLGLAQASVAVEIQGQPLPVNSRYPLGVSLKSGVSPYG